MKTLNEADRKLYFKMFLPLIDYVNEKKEVNNLKDVEHAKHLSHLKLKQIADAMWEDTCIIDEYLKIKSAELTERERSIIVSWKNCISDDFFVERHLKDGSILICNDGNIYQVCGITSTFEEMLRGFPMPVAIRATLIPFEDVIITDGIILPYGIVFGGGIKQTLKTTYMEAKNKGRIIKKL